MLNKSFNLTIGNDNLKGTDKYIYLGVTLDNILSFKPHIARIVNGCSQRVFSLSKIRKYIPAQVAI